MGQLIGLAGEIFSASDEAYDGSSEGAVGHKELRRLRAGEISPDEYVSTLVERATIHLQGALSPGRLEDMRALLRDEMRAAPAMREMMANLAER